MQTRDLLTEKRLRNLEEMVAEISVEELDQKIQAGEIFKLIEVSNPEDYQKAHIEGAINITLDSLLETCLKQFNKIQQLVIYVQDADSSVGILSARRLQSAGFSNVLLVKGGKEAWQGAGFSLEGENNISPDEEMK